MTIEEKKLVSTQIEAARKQGIEEGRNQKDREQLRWGIGKLIFILTFPVLCGCISLLVSESFWAGFILGVIFEFIPWWIFLFF